LRDERLKSYRDYKLVLRMVVTVGYTDAFEKQRKQAFGWLWRCGPPASAETSPYDGNLPDDDIETESRQNDQRVTHR
jgi:hypothetical protein